jgi:hypothetical protein
MIEGFVKELGCTVRECLDCGALVPGGPTRCGRCAKDANANGDALVAATLSEMMGTSAMLARDPVARREVEDAVNRGLPDGFRFRVDELGVGRLASPLHVTSISVTDATGDA